MNYLTNMMPSNPSVVIYLYLIADIEIYTTLSYSWDMYPLPTWASQFLRRQRVLVVCCGPVATAKLLSEAPKLERGSADLSASDC